MLPLENHGVNGNHRLAIHESNQEGEMPVLMRQDQRFDPASAAFERLSKRSGDEAASNTASPSVNQQR